ncbi:MAG: hypothetical protein ABL994_18775 [Verrucomicrobiales bacterium]
MATTTDLVQKSLGTEKFLVLAHAIDFLDERVGSLSSSQPIDTQIETLDLEELAALNSISSETLRKKINASLDKQAVVRPGKRWVIRKALWLEYLQRLEAHPAPDET